MKSTLLHWQENWWTCETPICQGLKKKSCEISTNDHPHNPNPKKKAPHSKNSSDGPWKTCYMKLHNKTSQTPLY